MRCYRQGDVVLREIKKLPKPAEMYFGMPVLAVGEQTGHSHRLEGGKVQMYTRAGTRYIEVLEQADLVHEEHQTIKIPPGTYAQHQEREYNYGDPQKIQLVFD